MTDTNTNVTDKIEQDLFEFCHLIGLGHSDFAEQRKKLAGYIAQALADAEMRGIEKAAKLFELRQLTASYYLKQKYQETANEIRALIKEEV